MWQQAGRSGRREKTSLSVYVAFEGPLDQYFMKFPHKLFRGPIECCHVDPNNDQVSLHNFFLLHVVLCHRNLNYGRNVVIFVDY